MNNAKVDILFIISLITRMLILFLMLEILVEMMDFLHEQMEEITW